MDAGITAAWDAGRAAWPAVALDRDAFAAHASALDAEALERHGSDLYLAAACLARVAGAIELFDRDVLGAARSAIQSIDSSAAFVDEAMQRLRANLMVGDDGTPRLAMYAGRGPLRAWVGIAAARTALMMLRSQKRAKEVPST